jgi:beta-mannosidase
MKNCAEKEWLPAKVPGSVYSDLLNNRKIEDPFWRDNEDKALPLMENDFEYLNSFAVSQSLLNSDRVILRCEGLDTLAEIYLNGTFLGKADNMHRTWEFDVKKDLNKDENSLRIIFRSPTRFLREADRRAKTGGSPDCLDGFPQLRKAHCMFGWDWGPRLPDAGIWRDIKLLGIKTARIDNVYITQKHKKNGVELNLEVNTDKVDTSRLIAEAGGSAAARTAANRINAAAAELGYEVYITEPGGKTGKYAGSPKKINIAKPELWWPNGFGAQPLYTVKVVLLRRGGVEIDSWEKRIGLRTMTVYRQKDKWGESFAHEVNGVRIFAMGADYIPEDNILSRVTERRTRKLLEQCRAANFNAIRVWGGGYYPGDSFFDICDELGLIVWVDFMFACAVYDLTEDFEKNIRAEIKPPAPGRAGQPPIRSGNALKSALTEGRAGQEPI